MALIEVVVASGDGLIGLEMPVEDSCRGINIAWSGGWPVEVGSFMFMMGIGLFCRMKIEL